MLAGPNDHGMTDFSLAAQGELDGGLTDDLRARVKGELEPGERLLWAGRSDPPLEPRGVGFYFWTVIAFALLGLAVFLMAVPRGNRHAVDESSMTGGLACLVIGSVFGAALIAGWNHRRTERRRLSNVCYAITDRRAVVWAPEPKSDAIRVQAVARGQVRNLVRVERPDGSGNLEFSGVGDNVFPWQLAGFKHIPEVRRVEQIIRNNLITNQSGPVT